eukprot:614865-Rhodomonas_salina.3
MPHHRKFSSRTCHGRAHIWALCPIPTCPLPLSESELMVLTTHGLDHVLPQPLLLVLVLASDPAALVVADETLNACAAIDYHLSSASRRNRLHCLQKLSYMPWQSRSGDGRAWGDIE